MNRFIEDLERVYSPKPDKETKHKWPPESCLSSKQSAERLVKRKMENEERMKEIRANDDKNNNKEPERLVFFID